MDKLKTRILLISVLLLLLFSVQSVVAVSNDNDGNLTSESIDLSICDNTGDISSNELSNNPVDVLSVSNELDVLSADEVSYSELDSEISVGGNIELLHDYYRCYGGESTISISGNNRVIDGRGAVIDMAGSTIRAFNVVGSGITIKNLTIKNANFNGNGAAIYFSSHGTVENCNFTNNSAKYGGAITFESIGTVRNCNFTNNSARIGGAITFEMMLGVTHEVSNCKFVNNKATALGGAVYFVDNGEVTYCNFTDNLASEGGGAIMFNSAGNVTDCNFTNNNATRYGGAIYFYSNGQSSNVTNCNFTDNSANCGGAVYFRYSGNGTVTNCNFTINTADYGGSIYFESSSGNVVSCNFVNGSSYYGGAVFWLGDNGCISDCNFTGNTAVRRGGAVHWGDTETEPDSQSDYEKAKNGTITRSNFINNTAAQGGAVFWFANDGNITDNCYFKDNNATAEGGAVYWKGNKGHISNKCTFTDNEAITYGGAIFWQGDNGALTDNCRFIKNSAYSQGTEGIYRGGGAIFWNGNNATVSDNCSFINNTADTSEGGGFLDSYRGGGAIYITGTESHVSDSSFVGNYAAHYGGAVYAVGGNSNVDGCSFENNSAKKGGAAFTAASDYSYISNCIFVNNFGIDFTSDGGAVNFRNYDNSLSNCTFIDNYAEACGGAVYWLRDGRSDVFNCSFENNHAYSLGGALFCEYGADISYCSFVNNGVTGFSSSAGAIYMGSAKSIENCNFTNNTASSNGGAVYFNKNSEGNVTNCSFADNKATGDDSKGGAIFFGNSFNPTTVTNCNFTNNSASYGGAIRLFSGSVTNCNFTGNNATGDDGCGGAVYFYKDSEGNVTNCSFTNNSATKNGGAIYFDEGSNGRTINCNFAGNTANDDGGAVYFENSGNMTNCNFTNNSASNHGGAVYFYGNGDVTNCNFTGNNANTGSAIYFYSTSATKTVFNSRFLNNRANAEALEVTKNYNNITITFTGKDNLLNAIYSRNDAEVTFTNVTYWSANGIAKTGSSAIKPSRSNKEAGQNITVSVIVNGKIVLTGVYLTDENGTIVLDIKAGENYFIGARHDTDSYYTEAEKTISNNTKFSVNVTSQTTNNRTVNITAKSNIPNEIIDGKLLFILPNSEEISANYGGNGTWWAVHTFDDYGVYEVNASYTGLDNVTVNNGTVTINDVRLSVVKSADKTEVTYNSTVQFTINITNYGSTEATNVEVSDWLPEGLTFIEAGVINSEGQYEVFDSPDLLILIGDEEFVTFFEFSSSDIIEDGGVERDIAQWSITRIAGGNSVILLITARANGLVMGNITNEVTVRYHENETDSIVNSTNITVIPANSSVSAEDVEVTYGDSIVVVVTSANATGVSYKVIGKDGIVKEGTVNVGENITGLDLAAGDYTVNLTTMVNGNYTASNYTSKITVKPANSSVSAEDVEVTYGKSIVVVVTSDNATGVSYMVIGKEGIVKEGTVNVGENITGLDLAAGDYTVNLTTMVNGNYATANYTSKITVKPANSSVKAEDVEVTYGDSIVVVVTSENATNVSYQIISSGAIVKEGTINIGENITGLDLAAGEYTVNLTTVVNSNYTAANYTSKITVKPANSTVSAEDAVASFGDAVSIPVSSVNATEISYRIIDANDKAVANGTVKPDNPISVSDLAAGDYTVSLTTVVDENHTSVSNSSKLHIRHVVSIVIAPVTGYACETVSFTVQFKYENGDPVSEGTAGLTVKYDNKELLAASRYPILSADESVPVSNGKATFNVKVDNPGTYPYVVTYSGGDADDVQAESTLTILKVNTTVSGVDISGKPDDKKDVTVTVLDYNNNPVANGTVTLTLNGKTYNSTVENGKAVLSVELPNPGEYNATVTYKGNDHYDSSSSSISVNVEKVNTKAPSAEDVSGKAGEKKDIKVKIVDENGNPVKNGTATLTVDGKTYTAEVINGVATFKGVVIPDEDTVADVYYQGNDYYNASSATISIKVKHDNNNTEPDNNDTDENKTTKHVSSEIVDANATGNPIAMMLLALCALVITYRKK